jgi:3-dehydroquinate synthetase
MHITEADLTLDRDIRFGDYRFGYHVRSGEASWLEFLERLAVLAADHYVVVTDDALPRDLVGQVTGRIATIGNCVLLTFPASEAAKSISTVEALSIQAEERAHITVASCVIALGGGLVANVAGFWAASQFRGINLVQLPTTLLSMADVMPSLKQGVNTPRGKNHLGAFYPPLFVWNNLSFLETLPTVEIRSALCEMIKFILTIPPEEGSDLYEVAAAALRPDGLYREEQLLQFIQLCVDAKCRVMRDDPFERWEGLIFEYGHTVGHALELLSYRDGHRPIPHGLAVGLGMLVAARISRMLGMLSRQEEEEHFELLQRNGAPTSIPAELPTQEILGLLRHDNKRGRLLPLPEGMVNMVLLNHLREPNRTRGTVLTQVEESVVAEAIDACKVYSL